MEEITHIKEILLLKDKKDVLKIHLYSKLLSMDITPYEKDLDIIIELYEIGGYRNEKEQNKFFNICIDKHYKKSIQSIRNTLALYTNLGILTKPRNKRRFVSEQWIPSNVSDIIFLDFKISHNAIKGI